MSFISDISLKRKKYDDVQKKINNSPDKDMLKRELKTTSIMQKRTEKELQKQREQESRYI